MPFVSFRLSFFLSSFHFRFFSTFHKCALIHKYRHTHVQGKCIYAYIYIQIYTHTYAHSYSMYNMFWYAQYLELKHIYITI